MGVVLGLCIVACAARAATLSVQGEFGGAARSATLEAADRNGVPYVVLDELAGQLGVGYRLTAGRVQLDLAGKSAWIHLDTADVDASSGPFSLSHALLREGGQVLIARVDIAPLFSNAFQTPVQVQSVEAGPAAPQPEFPAAQPEETPGAEAPAPARIIVLDPGHGGTDTGAEGRDGLTEKAIVLAIAEKTQTTLEQMLPVKVVLTRTEDVTLSDAQRLRAFQRAHGDVLVSLHLGASFSPRAHGAGVFCHEAAAGRSRLLAGALCETLAQSLERAPAAPRLAPLRLLAGLGDTPGVLVEAGCLTNASEEALLGDEQYQMRIAQGLAEGIRAYIETPSTVQ